MKKFLLLITASLVISHCVSADTSYLLIQGPFGSGSTVETFEWKVIYQPGSLSTGIDLLNAVLGRATDSGTTYQSYEVFSAGNNIQGASYIDFDKPSDGKSLFTISYTLGGTTVQQDSSYDPGWNYYVAGGAGSGGTYASGAWTFSNDGVDSRTLSDGSFDGWVFGATGFTTPSPATIAGGTGSNAPKAANFANATVVPEPAGAALLSLGVLSALAFRRPRKGHTAN